MVIGNVTINALFIVCCLAIAYVVMQIFAVCSFSIPSDSMQPAIHPGDRVLVCKIPTGARLFNISEAARGEKIKVTRLPGWRRFKRGDILVFNFVHKNSWDTITFNWQQYYIKRCLGEPGDTVEIKNFQYYVNSRKPDREYLTDTDFLRMYPTDSIARAERSPGYFTGLNDSTDSWTIRDFGPLLIPKKDMKIKIDNENIYRYRQIIEWETGKSVSRADSMLMLGDERLDQYTFSENYYFMAGDNNINSKDSRYWGLVPEPFIVGRASLIWWSENKRGIQWKRILKSL